jgi:hypothetical protein
MTALPLQRTSVAGVYRRGSRFVVVYRSAGRQRKQAVATLAEARTVKLARDAEDREQRRGPTVHSFALGWLDHYTGSGRDSVRENTRQEYRRLLETFALRYFDGKVRVRDLDRAALQGFADWLTARSGRDGRLSDRAVTNALTPLRLVLGAAVASGLLETTLPTRSSCHGAAAAAHGIPRRRAS